jgi:multidrug efflux pump subunit AcrB
VPAARLLKGRSGPRHDDLTSDAESGHVGREHGWIAHRYESFLRRRAGTARLGHHGDAIVAVIGALLYFRLETGFLPAMDEGGYVIDYLTPTGTSLQETDKMVRRIEAVLQSTPEVAGFTRRTGTEMGLFATEQNSGDILVHLKPRGERDKDVEEIISEQRARFAQELPAVEIEFVQLLQDMLGDLQGTPEPIEVKIFGDDIKTLGDIAERLEGKLEKIEGLVDLVGRAAATPRWKSASTPRAPPRPVSRPRRSRHSSRTACWAASPRKSGERID